MDQPTDRSAADAFPVKLELEGPLDLLLHLIKTNEVNITTFRCAHHQQYLDAII
jgi:hypothetical protein